MYILLTEFVFVYIENFVQIVGILREDTHKKSVFFSGRTSKVLPSLHQWHSGQCNFLFCFS